MLIRLLTLLALALAPALPARAQMQDDIAQVLRVSLIPGWRQQDGSHVAGLRFDLAPGWRTYWRSAGAAGISPQMDWRGSRGLGSVTPQWPTPTVFRQGRALSIGYDDDFVLPLLIQGAGGGAAHLDGVLDLGVCAEICLPARIRVSGDLPAGGAPDPAIRAALADRPGRIRADARCSLRPTRDGMALTGRIPLPPQGRSEAVVFEVPDPSLWVTDAVVSRQGGTLTATSELMAGGGRGVALDRSRVRITVIGDRGAVEIDGCRS
ncbi:protein-disulfide reductase DsbD domain-containing protein [Jannaschia ovalis]|uniref:Protein-disulfide reductase DsbD family protein n=1 Tax=Jannaschia ovalis TaxID=3038773 RepID=A0ABY8LEC9_9RHOB|nr:protein-disulfide reductase DsbD domain-containing protein [Jannaschia sp. GRR-S6-38]WGH79676.1 protein-disulfide reductase DsbD family protein [Jannaschia sp. GRR-S6-38]